MIPTHFLPFHDLLGALRQQYTVLMAAPSTPPYRLRLLLVSPTFRGDPDGTRTDELKLAEVLGVPWEELLANLHRLHIELHFSQGRDRHDRASIESLMGASVEALATPQLPLWMPVGRSLPRSDVRVLHVVEHDGRGFGEAVCWELAGLLAKQGLRTVLVDADPHSCGLEQIVREAPELQLQETVMGLRCRVKVQPAKMTTKSGATIELVGFAPSEEALDPDRAAFVFDWSNPHMAARLCEALVAALDQPKVVIFRHAAGLTPCVGALVRSLPGSVFAVDATLSGVGRRHMAQLMESSPYPSTVLVKEGRHGEGRARFWTEQRARPLIEVYDDDREGLNAAVGRVVEQWERDRIEREMQAALAGKMTALPAEYLDALKEPRS